MSFQKDFFLHPFKLYTRTIKHREYGTIANKLIVMQQLPSIHEYISIFEKNEQLIMRHTIN